MKKSLIFGIISGASILTAAAIATGVSLRLTSNNVNNTNNTPNTNNPITNQNNNILQNSESILRNVIYDKNESSLNSEIADKVDELNKISFPNFQITTKELESIRTLSTEDIYNKLISGSLTKSNLFKYEVVDFKNNLTKKTISFSIKVVNAENENEFLNTDLYEISWSLESNNEKIQDITYEELVKMSENDKYSFGSYNKEDFIDVIYKELSKDKNFDAKAEINYYDTQRKSFISENESKWADKKNIIVVDTKKGISFDLKEDKSFRKFLYRGRILSVDNYYVDSITISGQNMLDNWLTKSVNKTIYTGYHLVLPNITKTELEAERINTYIDRKEALKDLEFTRELFDPNILCIKQGKEYVSYLKYFLDASKGIKENILETPVLKLLVDSLNYNNNLGFDFENYEYNFVSSRFLELIEGVLKFEGNIFPIVNRVIVVTNIDVKSKLDGSIVKTQSFQFNINIKDIDLFYTKKSILQRMGINMVNDGSYGLSYSYPDGHPKLTEISNMSKMQEDKWFFNLWMNQQKNYVKSKFNVSNPKIEPIIYDNEFNQNIEFLLDKSKDTFEDTFRAIYGVDYNQQIERLVNEGRGTEAALLKNIQKIRIFGRINQRRTTYKDGEAPITKVYKVFQARGLQLFLDKDEKVGFGTRDKQFEVYQELIRYEWLYDVKL